jgi:hypothetical protein
LVERHAALADAPAMRFSALQPILMDEGIDDLLALHETAAEVGEDQSAMNSAAYCRSRLQQPREELDPPPLVTGDDLLARGIPPGPQYGVLLQRVRDAQLDDEIATRDQALQMIDRLRKE